MRRIARSSRPRQHERSLKPRGLSAVVVAFDGVVADTLGLRASALNEALMAIAEHLDPDAVGHTAGAGSQAIAGRTFAEAARLLLASAPSSLTSQASARETLVDLVALDAARRYTAALSGGTSLLPGAVEMLNELALSSRVVARADSARRDVDAILALSGLDATFAFVRCSDDTPRLTGASVESAWAAIDRRLLAGEVAVENRTALEVAEIALDAARPFVGRVQRRRFPEATAR